MTFTDWLVSFPGKVFQASLSFLAVASAILALIVIPELAVIWAALIVMNGILGAFAVCDAVQIRRKEQCEKNRYHYE